MPKFSKASQEKLATCHPFLQEICNELIKEVDFTVLCGHRDKEAQDEAFAKGASKLKWPKSKHNSGPSLAVDIAPYNNGIDWNNHVAFIDLMKKFKQIAEHKRINISCGCDWTSFKDYPHVQLI